MQSARMHLLGLHTASRPVLSANSVTQREHLFTSRIDLLHLQTL